MTYTERPDPPSADGLVPVIGIMFLLAGLALAVAWCQGCSPSAQERAEHAVVVATYERELDHCREQGKASRSYAVYEACAKAVDARLCNERGLRCNQVTREDLQVLDGGK